MRIEFEGRWATVTGASSGLGAELAKQLARRRANLILTARSADKLDALASSLGASEGIETRVISADLSVPDGAARLAEAVDALDVDVEHLFANAGAGTWGAFVDQSSESQTSMLRLNCEALVVLTHHFAGGMVRRRRGGIMLVASTASFQPTPNFGTYAATKGFVRSFGEALAQELAVHGVVLNVLCPGPVATGFQARAGSAIVGSQKNLELSAEETVRQGLAAYERGKVLFVPGVGNKVGRALSTLLPNRLVVPALARLLKDRDGA